MKDWINYITDCINSDLWGFVLLDYYYTKKKEGEKEEPSQFIDRVLSELPKKGIEPVIFHNTLLSVCVHLLGNSFSDITEKSVNYVDEVKNDLTAQQLDAIISQYDIYGKRDLFMAKLKARKVYAKETVAKEIKQDKIIMKNKKNPFDIGIIIALKEEFREFHNTLKNVESQVDPISGNYYYFFEQPYKENPPYRCVASFVGDKGEKKAALLTENIIRTWEPKTIVVLGIGASIDKDVVVGDVVVAKQVDSYSEDSKAIGKNKSSRFTLQLGGDIYRASDDLIKFAQNFEFTNKDLFQSWKQACSQNLIKVLLKDKINRLIDKKILRENQRLLEGNIASGPTVGAAVAFTKWLKNQRDRNYCVLEMESGGVLAAIYAKINPSKSLVLRGISDYGDNRKPMLDQIGDGALRKYAMHNVIQLLWSLLEAGALPRS